MGAEGSTGPWIVGSLTLKKLGIVQGTVSGTPVNGTSGTLAGKIATGGTVIDTTTGNQWLNIGTKASPVWSPQAQFIPFNVSSANILAMFGAPVALISAPPAGYSIIINNAMVQMTRTATAYAGGGTVNLVYSGGGAVCSQAMAAGVITGGAGVVVNQLGAAATPVVSSATGVSITNNTGAFTTGTGTMIVYIDYSIVKQ